MTTTTIPETRTAVSPHEKGEAAPPVAVPGRDLALFVLLLLATDFSGLLHIYGLSWLYGEPTFLGLGWTMVLVAAALLVLPARERPGALAVDSPELHGVVLPPALLAALGEDDARPHG
jgi:hypothetical protein